MMGLLTFIRAAETDPNLVALALGRFVSIYSEISLMRSPQEQEFWPDYRGGWNREDNSNMWVTLRTNQYSRLRQCGRFTEAWTREVSLYTV